MREKFLTFNVGHLLTLVAIIASGVGLYSASARSDERQAARLDFIEVKLSEHTQRITAHEEAISKLDRIGTTKNNQSGVSETEKFTLLRRTVDEHMIALRKLDVVANDVAWIKTELLRSRKANGDQ